MRIILTGITGNLGYEVAAVCSQRNIEITPVLRTKNQEILKTFNINKFILCDLTQEDLTYYDKDITCIIHCAGDVSFNNKDHNNERMIKKVASFAKTKNLPLYYISTAFTSRQKENAHSFNNNYEEDKYRSEDYLQEVGIDYAIFRPSVLIGNSGSGYIRQFTAFYSLTGKFIKMGLISKAKGNMLRFPEMNGKSDMVPVDQAAKCIVDGVEKQMRGTYFITNPKPPDSSWVLRETMYFAGLSDVIQPVKYPFADFGQLNLSVEERNLYEFSKHYAPYWSMKYSFPSTLCKKNFINRQFLKIAIEYFTLSQFTHGS
jgi:nucleoside-diphosphate-sugar epimerase